MKYKVDMWNDFCRVFELPEKFSNEYCFGGGIQTTFLMVDWFCPVGMGQTRVTKEFWEKEVGPIEIREIEDKWLIEELQPFLQKKRYTKPDRKYLVITDFGMTFLFSKSC
jgi:hypothetical protein